MQITPTTRDIKTIKAAPEVTYIYLSDVHLGSKFANYKLLQSFLQTNASLNTTFVLLGDIYDLWKLKPPQSCMRGAMGESSVVFTPGNHDHELGYLAPIFGDCNIVSELVLDISSGVRILSAHGHNYDSNYGTPLKLTTRIKDLILYGMATFLNVDFRNQHNWARWLAAWYYNKSKHYNKIAEACKKLDARFSVSGHTHLAGVFDIDDVLHFNTGSWLRDPAALFIRGGRYALHMVKEGNLQPAEEIFNDFR